jgi:hypothetical protein
MLQLPDKPFPFFLNDHRKNTILIFATSSFVTLFLTLYIPFENTQNTLAVNIRWGIFCFLALYVNLILIPKLFPAVFELSRWTLPKYVLFNGWLLLSMGLLFTVINSLLYCGDMNAWPLFIKTQREVVLTGLLPLIVVTMLARNNMLRQNIADASETNSKLHEIQTIKAGPKPSENATTIQTDTNERFSLNLTDLVYIVAKDNYSEIYWNENGNISRKLLRVTLKHVEAQLTNQFIVRCHRSYLINVQSIESISGNANGYKLQMKNADVEIPVSRAKGKEIIAHIQQIRDLLDLRQ